MFLLEIKIEIPGGLIIPLFSVMGIHILIITCHN